MAGVVQGVSPSMEEAAQTLRADRWRTFRTVTWPLMRPGARQRLPDRIRRKPRRFRQSAGARRKLRRALDRHLLRRRRRAERPRTRRGACHRAACADARRPSSCSSAGSGKRSYTTLTGKGDSGLHARLPDGVRRLVYATTMPWLVFTFLLYALILVGGFVESLGIDNTPTLQALRHRLRGRTHRLRPALGGPCLAILLRDDDPCRHRRAAHRGDGAADGLSPQPAAFRRAGRLRVHRRCCPSPSPER